MGYPAKEWYKNKKVAESYEEVRFGRSLRGRLINWLEKRALRQAMEEIPSSSLVLDLACGSGRITTVLLKLGYRVVGADISNPMLSEAKKKLSGWPNLLGFVNCSVENLPYSENHFDCIIAFRLMTHLPPIVRVQVLNEMRRVSKKWIIVSHGILATIPVIRIKIEQFLRRTPTLPWFAVSKQQLKYELRAAQLKPKKIFPVASFLSPEKVLLLSKCSSE